MAEEKIEIPKHRWYQFIDTLTRLDELLEAHLKLEQQILEVLKGIRPPVVPPAPPVVPIRFPPAPPELEPLTIRIESLIERVGLIIDRINILQELVSALVPYPNRVAKVEIDTAKTEQISLRKEGKLEADVLLGFEIEDVGGGFTYCIRRQNHGKDWRAAATGDKWEVEFDDLWIKGSGTAGTAKIWLWWRALR